MEHCTRNLGSAVANTALTHTHGITRFEYRRTQGWLARYYARGTTIQRLFSDSRYRYDEERSRAAAQAFLLDCSKAIEPRSRFRQRRTARTTSGRVGVCLVTKRERSGAHVRMWSVNYVARGQRKTKTFRTHHFTSEAEAVQVAVVFRQTQERAMQRERQAWLQCLYI